MATRMKATGSVALVILALALGYWASHRSGDSGMNKNVVVGVPADSSTTRAPKESVRDARGAIEVRCDYQDYFPDKGKRKVVAHLHNTTVEAFTGSVTISFEDASGGPAGHASLNVESLAPEGTAVQIVWADRTAARESSYSEGKLTTVALSNGGTILPLSRIAGKSFRQAKAVLGAPVTIHDDVLNNGWPVKTVTWAQHGIEIEFVQGKAQWITINDPSPWNFDSFGLQALGLPESQDNDSGPAAKRWSNTNGCQEITAFLGGASRDISYVYIVVSLDPTGF